MRIALVGLGDAGSNLHLPALAAMPSIVLAGVCDVDQTRRDNAAKTHRVPPFEDLQTMLVESRPDVVIVATPPDAHADHCLRALAAGAHVVCEKPFASSVVEADAIIAAAAKAGRQVALNHEFREMPIFRALRDELARMGTAKLQFLQLWQMMNLAPGTEGNWRGQLLQRTLFEAGVHLVDFAMMLFAETPARVQAATYGGHTASSDAVVVATLEFSRGRLAHITQNRLCKGERQYFEARADTADASLRASFGGRARLSTGLLRHSRPHARLEFGPSGLAWKEVGHQRSVLARNPKNPTVVATRLVLEATFAAFRAGTEPPTSGARARTILEVVAACYHSAAVGRRLRLDDPEIRDLQTSRMGGPTP